MQSIDITFKTPEENLACDEALLETSESGLSGPMIRFWESAVYFVVLGYSRKITSDTTLDVCSQNNIPILRRISGGGTVLQGPGCFNYSLILPLDHSGKNLSITQCNRLVMETHRNLMSKLLSRKIKIQGDTDLTDQGQKFSGNSQRRGKKYFLFHGTLLYGFDLSMIEKVLPQPDRQPDYRNNRPHHEFIINVPVAPNALKNSLTKAWGATLPLKNLPLKQIEKLSREKYSSHKWIHRF